MPKITIISTIPQLTSMRQLPISINGSSQIQPPQVATSSFSIESLEFSVQNLIKSWYRRQRWHLYFFNSSTPQDLNRAPWRTQLANFLESTSVHLIVIFLLLLDLIFTIHELSSSVLSCPSSERKKIEKFWYHYVGIAILSMLSARLLALAVGLGSSFFRRPGYVVDGAVVMGALVLEAFFERRGGGLLAVVSFWRVVRVVESAFELSDGAIEAQIEWIVCQFEALREENRRLLESIGEKDKIIEKLQEEVDQCRRVCDNSSLDYEHILEQGTIRLLHN
jgi:hypothetical protein